VLERAQQAGVARDDIDAADLMQLVGGMCMARNASLERNERLLTLVLDGIRTTARH
jgi:aspartyl/asparaginyl beta-hydroxylase (cupin superfamily)